MKGLVVSLVWLFYLYSSTNHGVNSSSVNVSPLLSSPATPVAPLGGTPVPSGTIAPTPRIVCNLCASTGGGSTATSASSLPITPGSSTTCGELQSILQNYSPYDISCQLIQSTGIPGHCGCPTQAPSPAPVAYAPCPICKNAGEVATNPNAYVDLKDTSISPTISSSVASCSTIDYFDSIHAITPTACSKLDDLGISEICGCRSFQVGATSCASATTVNVGETTFSNIPNITVNTTDFKNRPCIIDSPSAWFQIVGQGEIITVDLCGFSDFFTKISVVTGSAASCDQLTCIGGNSDYGCKYTFLSKAGKTYFPVVSGYYGEIGHFNLTLTDHTNAPTTSPSSYPTLAPCNVCSQANERVTNLDVVLNNVAGVKAPITCGDLQASALIPGNWDSATCSGFAAESTTCGCAALPKNDRCLSSASISTGETVFGVTSSTTDSLGLACGGIEGLPASWYKYTSGSSPTVVTASTCTEFALPSYTYIAVYSGSCANLACVGSNEGSPTCKYQAAVINWTTSGNNEDYFIRVSSYTEGDFLLSVQESPVVPTIAPAPTLSPTIYPTPIIFPDCNICDSSEERVSRPNVQFGSSFGYACQDIEFFGLTGQIDSTICSLLKELNLAETCGCITPTGNDVCNGATEISFGQTLNGTITNSTWDNSQICPYDNYYSGGVWYKATGTGDPLKFDTCLASDFYVTVSLYVGNNCNSLSCVATNNGFCGFGSRVTVDSTVGATYYILVHGYEYGNTGNFSLTLSEVTPPSNDLCPNADSILPGQTVSGTTTDATPDNEPSCGDDHNNTATPGVWYHVRSSDQPSRLVVSTCDSGSASFDIAITVFSGSCGNLVCVAGNDNYCGTGSRVVWESDTATDFFVLVRGTSNFYYRNDFVFELTEVPATPTVSPKPSYLFIRRPCSCEGTFECFCAFGSGAKDGGGSPNIPGPPPLPPPYSAAPVIGATSYPVSTPAVTPTEVRITNAPYTKKAHPNPPASPKFKGGSKYNVTKPTSIKGVRTGQGEKRGSKSK